jgi:hypothetical protein
MARMWKAAALLAVLAVTARAQERAGPSLPPWITKASFNKDGKLVVQLVVPDVHEEVREVEVVRGGRRVIEKRKVPVETPKVVNRSFDTRGLQVSDAEGNRLKVESARRLLDRPTPVVISGDGRPVSPAYLKMFRRDTLVLILPPPPPPPADKAPPERIRPPERPSAP